MTELFQTLNQYWALMTGALGFFAVACFTLGRVWTRTETAIRAMGNLHKDTQELKQFSVSQSVRNDTIMTEVVKIETFVANHAKEDTERMARIEARIDSIFRMMSNRQED